MTKLPLAIFLLASQALADTPAAPPASATAPTTYELRDLKPDGLMQPASAVSSGVRQYFQFQGEQGMHHVIYEEMPMAPALPIASTLRQYSSAHNSRCSLDIECAGKAFCTGDCKQMFYEISNVAGDAASPDRATCKITSFSCESAPTPGPMIGSAPAPATRMPASTEITQ